MTVESMPQGYWYDYIVNMHLWTAAVKNDREMFENNDSAYVWSYYHSRNLFRHMWE